jgi:hypothetical protein
MTGTQYDAPNQQVVRADGSAPWDEGTGGGKAAKKPAKTSEKATSHASPPEKGKDD